MAAAPVVRTDGRKPAMMRQLKIQTRDGRPHTLYSLRRAIAQEAYDERLEEEYHFATDESDEEEGDGKKV